MSQNFTDNTDQLQQKIAIIGRPNVGKSTLFNRLIGKKLAIVNDRAGVTRDYRELKGQLADLCFILLDTAGIDQDGQALSISSTELSYGNADALAKIMSAQSMIAAKRADILFFMVDGRAGLQPMDFEIATLIRKLNKPALLLVNKCEGVKGEMRAMEAYALGMGEPIALSAEHGEGLGGLYQALRPFLESEEQPEIIIEGVKEGETEEDEAIAQDQKILASPLKIAIAGRPNVGKSTLINHLVGEPRVLTGDIAGLTRDAIYVDAIYQNIPMRLVDTAGLRRKAKIIDVLEKAATHNTRQAIELSEIVILMLSAEEGLDKQDLHIAAQILEEGRALVIAINKADLSPDRKALEQMVQDRLQISLHQARGIPVILISAQKGKNINALIKACVQQREIWLKRINTGTLNEWLRGLLQNHPPPAIAGRRPKPRYIAQIKNRPPTFGLFGARVSLLPDSWQRYLINRLRTDFNLNGIPLRLILRSNENPYHDKQDK